MKQVCDRIKEVIWMTLFATAFGLLYWVCFCQSFYKLAMSFCEVCK